MPQVALLINQDDWERRSVGRALRNAGWNVLEASSSVQGLVDVLEDKPTLIVLAAEMPPLEASELLAILRRLTAAPIILIGSRGDPGELKALEQGADSYMRRPFGPELLVARARALFRRYREPLNGSSAPENTTLHLTRTEQRLLACLTAHNQRPVSQRELLLEVWGGTTTIESVKFYVRRLRQKLMGNGHLELQTVRGVGHRLVRGRSLPTGSTAEALGTAAFLERTA